MPKKNREINWDDYARRFADEAKRQYFDDAYISDCLNYAKRLVDIGLPVIYDGTHFCQLVGYEASYIFGASNATSNFYRHFRIKKKSGGFRDINEPLPSLKEIQRWILDNILVVLPVSPAAKAYVPGRSIRENARFHRNQEILLKIDIKDFFPSIGVGSIYNVFRRCGYSNQVSMLLACLCTLDGELPQGAPTSAALSNLVFRPLDNRFFGFAQSIGIRYTRYADDITFSGYFSVKYMQEFVRSALSAYGFSMNHKKTRVMRRGQRQIVTGIVVNETLRAPREIRRKLRDDYIFIKKFGIESHASRRGIRNASYLEHLIGIAGYILSIDSQDKVAKEALHLFKKLRNEYISEAPG